MVRLESRGRCLPSIQEALRPSYYSSQSAIWAAKAWWYSAGVSAPASLEQEDWGLEVSLGSMSCCFPVLSSVTWLFFFLPTFSRFPPLSPFFCSLGWMSNVLGQLPLCLEALNYSTVPQAKASFSLEKKSGWWQRSPTKWVCDRLLAVCPHEIPQSTIPAPTPSKTGAGHGSPFILEPIFSFGKKY